MTIKDVAAMAGVSTAAVSKVLNNKPISLSEETRERILRIAKEYNYKPYRKYIESGSPFSGVVGLMLPGNANEYSDFILGAQTAAIVAGYSVMLCTCQSKADEKKNLNHLFTKGVDGLALYLEQAVDLDAMLAAAPEKLVFAAASNCQVAAGQCAVCCDFVSASQLATEHLIAYGHREIALIGWRSHFLSSDMIAGYNDALYSSGIIMQEDNVCLCDSPEDVVNCVQQFTYGSGTAFLCQDIKIAACVYRTLARYGLQIPWDYSVIGLSFSSASPDVFEPALTVMDVRLQELGRSAMEALVARIEKGTKETEPASQLPPLLKQGGSVAAPPGNAGKRIVVVGSMNMDVMIHLDHIPTSGENLRTRRILNLPGGKGANQGVGIAKLGGRVCTIGCLGNDQEGRLLYKSLTENGVNTTGVRRVSELPTGKAYILVAPNGDSTIIRTHGANEELQPAVVEANAACFEDAQFCLVSTEMPWDTVIYTIEYCFEKGIKTIVKPTVQREIPPEILKKITFLVPNEKELETLVGGKRSVEEKANALFAAGTPNIIVTLGEKGCYFRSEEITRHFPAADFQAVDTTGAGDAFVSALAVYLCEGHSIVSSIKFATYAAGLSVTRDGVQPALADRMALDIYSEQFNSN